MGLIMAKAEKKSAAGRKRKYPEGSVEHRFRVPPEIAAALERFIARQAVPPEDSAVFLAALSKFLTDEGDLKP